MYSALVGACKYSIGQEITKYKQQVHASEHTDEKRGVVILKEITFTNRVRIGEQRLILDELPEEQRRDIVNSICFRSLLTIPNTEVIQTA